MKPKTPKSQTHTCPICGHTWIHGLSGTHDCSGRLLDKFKKLQEDNKRLKLLLLAAESLLLASTGPEDGPTSYVETKERWMHHFKDIKQEAKNSI